MGLSVADRASAVATFRFVAVTLMETLARWVPTTPEMEVKVVFGQHIWDVAQHADALGRRTHELRSTLHHSRRPTDAYAAVLAELSAVEPTADRLAAFYEVMLPGLARRYRRYLERTDALMDAPTVKVLERALGDMERMASEARETRDALSDLPAPGAALLEKLRAAESGAGEMVAAAPATPAVP